MNPFEILRLARAASRMIDVLGDPEKALRWLRVHNRGLGAVPLDLLASERGTQLVIDELTRLEHGVFS